MERDEGETALLTGWGRGERRRVLHCKNTSRENTHSEDGRSHNPSTSPDFKALHLSVQCFYFVSKNEALTVVNALWVMNKNTPELQI